VIGQWDFDSDSSLRDFWRNWGNSYSTITHVNPTAASVTTASYIHSHVVSYLNTVERTCCSAGYQEFICDICSKVVRINYKDPVYEDGHKLVNRFVMEAPTNDVSGRCSYECENCYTKFVQKIPKGYGSDGKPIISGDVNGSGNIDVIDITYMRRYLSGSDVVIDSSRADLNNDGRISFSDLTILKRKLTSGDIAS